MAGPDITGDEKDKLEQEKLKLERELAQAQNVKTPDEDVKPAVMAGLSDVGTTAKSLRDQQDPSILEQTTSSHTAQDLKDFDGQKTDFDASPDDNSNKAFREIQEGLQNISGRIAGVQGVENSPEHEEERKRKDSDANIRAIALSASIAAAYEAIEQEIEVMQDDVEELSIDFTALAAEANNTLLELGTQKTELEADLVAQKAKVDAMKNDPENAPADFVAGDKAMRDALLKQAEAEVRNTEERLKLINETMTSTKQQLQETEQELGEAAGKLVDLQRQKQAAMQSGDPKGKLSGLEEQIEATKDEIQQSKDSIGDLQKQTNLTKAIAGLSSGALEGKSHTCGANAQVENDKTAMINARTDLTQTLGIATSDGHLTQMEITDIKDRFDAANITSESKATFALAFADFGGEILTDNGPLIGNEAQTFMMNEWGILEADMNFQLDATQEQISQTETQITQTESELAANTEKLDASTAKLDALTNTGTNAEKASAALGVATVGDNYSRKIDVVMDKDGKTEVHKDYDTGSYYYLDASNQRVDYDPNDPSDADQILNFDNNKDGGARMMSMAPASPSSIDQALGLSSPANTMQDPVKRFANDTVNIDASLARVDQKFATVDIASGEQELATLNAEIEALKNVEGILQADLDKIQEIQNAIASGSMTPQDAQTQLEQFKQQDSTSAADTVASSSTTTTDDSVSESLNLDTPEYSLAEAEQSRTNTLESVVAAAQNGGSIPQDQYDSLKQDLEKFGMSSTDLDQMMDDNGVVVANNGLDNSNLQNNIGGGSPQVFGGTGFKQVVEAATLFTIAPAMVLAGGTKPAEEYKPFCESDAFLCNSEPNATYAEPTKIPDVAAKSPFEVAQLDQPTPTGLTPEEAYRQEQERLALEDLKRQELAALGGGPQAPQTQQSTGTV